MPRGHHAEMVAEARQAGSPPDDHRVVAIE